MNSLETNIVNIYGEAGKLWIQRVPSLLQKYAELWHLTNLTPMPNLSYNYVCAGLQGDRPVILKLAIDQEGLRREIAVLRLFHTVGGVEVLGSTPDAVLMKRALPGGNLKRFFPHNDKEAVQIFCDVVKRLHQLPKSWSAINLPHMRDWLSLLDQSWPIPESALQLARNLRDELFRTTDVEIILHGDLHHENILQDNDHWVIIDPKGVIGDPIFELAAFLRNPIRISAQSSERAQDTCLLDVSDPIGITRNRIVYISQALSLPFRRIAQASYVQAILSWVWAIQNQGDKGFFQELSQIFYKLQIEFSK